MSTAELVVTGIGVVSPWGSDPAHLQLPDVQGCFDRAAGPDEVWFDLAAELGARGYKYVPDAARYLLAATRRALADAGELLPLVPETRRSLAVGTNSGIAGLIDAMDETVTTTDADQLSPARAPYFSINTLAGRVAMDHGIKGWNLTLTSPRTAGLEAVLAGGRAVAAGRSDLLLAAAAEAPLPAHHPGHRRSEAGAAVLVLEPRAAATARGATDYGSCRTVVFFLPPDAPPPVAERTVADALARLLADEALAEEVLVDPEFVESEPARPESARSESAEPARPAAPRGVREIPPVRLVADPCPVGTALAAHLHRLGARTRPAAPGYGALLPLLHVARGLIGPATPQLVATASPDGTCAVTLLRPRERPNNPHRKEDSP